MAAMDVCGVEDFGCGKDGPVLTMMNKRLRALKKKYNRIVQLEAAKNEGKAINKEQEDVLKSKVQVLALIDEYGRLREPLAAAVREEIADKEKEWALAKDGQVIDEDKDGVASNESVEEVRTESEETSNDNLENAGGGEAENGGGGADADAAAAAGGGGGAAAPLPAAAAVEESEKSEVLADSSSVTGLDENLMLELIQLLYFALLFDVRPHDEAHSFMRKVKYHERVSCLSYDLVTDDSTSHLTEADLDALALFGSLVTSRPPNTTLSHRDALQTCIAHARHWLLNSESVIEEDGLNITYSELRERLNRILATEYYTMTPELQTVTSEVAADFGVPQELYVNGDIPASAGNVSDSSWTNADGSQLDVNQSKVLEAQPAEEQEQQDDSRSANPRQPHPQQSFQNKYRGNRGGNGNAGGGGGNSGGNYGRGRGRGDSGNYGRGRGRGDTRGYRGGGGYAANGNRGGGNAGNGGGGQYYDQSGYYQRSGYYGRRGRGYYNNVSSPNQGNGPSPAVAS